MKTSEYNKNLFQIAPEEAREDCARCMLETNYTEAELLDFYRAANSWDGSFEFVDTWYLEDLIDCCAGDTKSLVRLVEDVASCDRLNVYDLLRYDSLGNLEAVTESDLETEATDNLEDLAWWIVNDSGAHYVIDELDPEDQEIFEAWDNGYSAWLCPNEECEEAALELDESGDQPVWTCPVCGCSTSHPEEDACTLD